jgi:hypothetical protein
MVCHVVGHSQMGPPQNKLTTTTSALAWSWEVRETNSIILFLNGTSQEQVYQPVKARWWAPWLSVCIFSHFCTVSGWSRDRVTCHRHHTTYADLCQSFPMIFSNLRWFLPSGDVSHSLQPPNQHHVRLWKFYGSVKRLLRTLACR